MTPLQSVAMGLVIVFLRAPFGGFDALVDPVGWGLVLAGLLRLRPGLPHAGTPTALAWLAAVVSVPLTVPSVADRLTPAGQWGASVPQTAFCLVLCGSLAVAAEHAGDREAPWFGLLRWTYLGVLVGPVLVYGGHVDALTRPVALLAVVANAGLVYLTFAVSRRGYGTSSGRATTSAHG